MPNKDDQSRRCVPRRGVTSLEVIVAFTLLSGVLAVSTTLVVRHGRLLAEQRDYRLALDEVSNQLDRLAALPEEELSEAMEQLSPSPFTASRLPGAKLSGELEAAEMGQRITLRLVWDEPQRDTAPVSLAAWIFPQSDNRGDATPGNDES